MFDNKQQILIDNGKKMSEIFEILFDYVKPGVSTYEIDQVIEKMIIDYNAIPSFKGYSGFPAASCISVNEVLVHGIPNKKDILNDGDIVSVDIGIYKNGYHVDAARTYSVGTISKEKEMISEICKESFFKAIKEVRVGDKIGKIGHVVQTFVESNGYSIIRDLVGHGVGKELHEEPQVPNYGNPNQGMKIYDGQSLAIEPMISAGSYKIKTGKDGWTVRTIDDSITAHYENTVIFTKLANRIVTL